MKKIVTLSALSLGILFLAGCGQQSVSQTQPVIPAPTPAVQQPVDNQQAEFPAIPSNKQPDASGKFAGWQTYNDMQHGLEFKYPAGFVIYKESANYTPGSETIGMLAKGDYDKKVENGGYQGGPSQMYISYSVDNNPNSKLAGSPISFADGTAVGGAEKDGGAGYGGTYKITARRNGYIFNITFWDGGKLTVQEKLIISSFKFTK